jgi:hypothetical protein
MKPIAPNELLVPKDILEKEFLNLAEAYGVSVVSRDMQQALGQYCFEIRYV